MPNLFIGPYKEGLERDVEPWLLPNDAFPTLEDAYLWRGRCIKKESYSLVGRLHRIAPTLPDALGNTVAPGAVFAGTIAAANRPISPGTVTITVAGGPTFTDYQAVASGRLNPHYNGIGTLTSSAVNTNYGTIDYNTGAVTLVLNPPMGVAAVTVTAAQRNNRLAVMGIATYEQTAINRESAILFDEDYSYDYNAATGWFRDVSFYKQTPTQNPVVWTGTNSDFFWTCNYYTVAGVNIFWATNNVEGKHGLAITAITQAAAAVVTIGVGHTAIVGDVVFFNEVQGMVEINGLSGRITAVNAGAGTITVDINSGGFTPYTTAGICFFLTKTFSGDGIRFYDGFGLDFGWRNFCPPLQALPSAAAPTAVPSYLMGALIVMPYKDRLLAFNTVERPFAGGGGRYRQRVRWSQNGTPFYALTNVYAATTIPREGTEWADDIIGKGGYYDAPTNEAIVSVALIRDTLLVFFERSTWQLRYTGNEILPFVWERINTMMGAESTFSPVVFDTEVYAVGDKGIIAANSISVERIDQKIPDEVFNFHNENDGPTRVHGIRDFQKQMAYWIFPNDDKNETFPDKILALNYLEGSYAIFNDSFTCFGTMQFPSDFSWANLPYKSWKDWNLAWGAPAAQSYFPSIVAGNQRGFILDLSVGASENASSMDLITATSITAANPAICQVTNHNLSTGQFVKITNVRGFGTAVAAEAAGTSAAASVSFSGSLANFGVLPGTVVVTIGALVFTDIGDGTFHSAAGAVAGTIEYETGNFTVTFAALGAATPVTVAYTWNTVNYRIFYVQYETANTFSLWTINPLTDMPAGLDLSAFAAYQGSGQIAVIDNFDIVTKRFSPFIEQGKGFTMPYVETLLDTNIGEFSINVYADQMGNTPVITLLCSSQDFHNNLSNKHWSRFFTNTSSEFIQLEFTMSNYQMTQNANPASDFVLHALSLNVNPSGRLI